MRIDQASKRVEVCPSDETAAHGTIRCALRDLHGVLEGKTMREEVGGRSLLVKLVGDNVWLLMSLKEPKFEGSCLISKGDFARALKELECEEA